MINTSDRSMIMNSINDARNADLDTLIVQPQRCQMPSCAGSIVLPITLDQNICTEFLQYLNLNSNFIFPPDNEIETNITKLINYRADQSLYNGNNSHDSFIIIYMIFLSGVYIY